MEVMVVDNGFPFQEEDKDGFEALGAGHWALGSATSPLCRLAYTHCICPSCSTSGVGGSGAQPGAPGAVGGDLKMLLSVPLSCAASCVLRLSTAVSLFFRDEMR
ncbi:hypothetical protein C2857_001973 [Epichloe festucae Fl1]|uniref:Uncharacterized protein n=1 Tax=Epichloe festucae (strain Fl1) TaxID=877507 RepID=A0A7S9PVF7_EPIFF|nr:hypothetical protein C2857_001973 [Epichloe festucae Fl1]